MKKESEYLKLLTSNYCKLHSYVLCLVCNKADADDIMQEVAVVMWKSFDKFEAGTSFIAWAKTIARNKVMDHQKMKQRARNKLDPRLLEIMYKERQEGTDSIDEKIMVLENCIKKLQMSEQSILKLRYFENKSVKDMAANLNLPLHTMYRRISRLHELLLGCVKRHMMSEGVQ